MKPVMDPKAKRMQQLGMTHGRARDALSGNSGRTGKGYVDRYRASRVHPGGMEHGMPDFKKKEEGFGPSRSAWASIAEAPMAWDRSDVEQGTSSPRSPKRPPPIPVKVKDASGRPVQRLPGVHEAVPQAHPSQDTSPLAAGRRQQNIPASPDRRRFDKPTRQIPFVQGSFDVTVPGEGTYRVPAQSAQEAAQAIVTWFREDQEPGQNREIDPGTLVIARTRVEEAGGATAGGSLVGYQMSAPEANEDELAERVFRNMLEIVRKKKGGGGFVLYGPNKGKKKKPKPLGEFPTRLAAKEAELARVPPKNPEELKRARKRIDKIRKDPKARARAEKNDLSGRKRTKRSGAPAHDRRKAKREEVTRLLARDIHERLFHEASFGLGKSGAPRFPREPEDEPTGQASRPSRSSLHDRGVTDKNRKVSRRDHSTGRPVSERLFHEDEVPGSPWDERIADIHPDHLASDRKLANLHKGLKDASIGSLGDAQKALAKLFRKTVKVNAGDVSHDEERGKTFMPVMLDVAGAEVGPVHLYVDGGHVKIEVSDEARQQIGELEPDVAQDIRGKLMGFEEEHLPRIDGARKAWAARDSHLDRMHKGLEKHINGMSDVERHLAKKLLGRRR